MTFALPRKAARARPEYRCTRIQAYDRRMDESTRALPTTTTATAFPRGPAETRRAEIAKLLPRGARWGTDVGAASIVRQRVESLPPQQVTRARLVLEVVELSKALAFCWDASDVRDEQWADRLQNAQRIHDVVQLVELLIAADAEQTGHTEQQKLLGQDEMAASNS